MKYTIIAWTIAALIFLITISVDFATRGIDGEIHTGGINEPFSWIILIACLSIATNLWFKGSSSLNKPVRFIVVGIQIFICTAAWLYFSLLYVCIAGIDCI